jgi:GNAT superfamily N-acetyltransferase
MRILESHDLSQAQKQIVFGLWNRSYPKKISYAKLTDFEKYLDGLNEQRHYLLISDHDHIEGWGFSFSRDAGRWFAIILDEQIQGKGYGTGLLSAIRQKESSLLGWVVDHDDEVRYNGAPYRSPLAFYLKNDFVVCPDVRLETEQISAVKIMWER